MFLDGCGKVTGCILLFAGLLLIIGGIIGGLLIPNVKDEAFLNVQKYSHDKKFNNIDYDDCENKTRNVFFYNITNVADFLNGSKALLELVGPYNTTRESCVFDEKEEGNERVYREYFKDPVFTQVEGNKYTKNDIIYNVNPGYLGIMFAVQEQTGSSSNLEFNFETNLVGPGLLQVIEGMQSTEFTDQVKVGGITLVLYTIRETIVNTQLIPVVRAVTTVGYFGSVIQAIVTGEGTTQTVAESMFFNDNTAGGYASYIGAPQTFTDETVRKLLHGSPSTDGVLGWLADPVQGRGVLAFLKTVSNSSNVPALAAAYGLAPQDIGGLAQFLNNTYINVVNGVLAAQNTNVGAAALGQFYGQWANVAVDPTGWDINQDGQHPDGFELGPIINGTTVLPTGLPLAIVQQLWNDSRPDAFMNVNGIAIWFDAIVKSQAGDMSGLGALAASFGLNGTQVGGIFAWLGNWQQNIVGPFILADFGVTEFRQLAYLQWGNGAVLGGGSIKDYEPTLTTQPEFVAYARNKSIPIRFNAVRSEQLLNGTNGFLKDKNVGMFLGLVARGAFTTINQLWGLNQTEAGAMAGYFQYIVAGLVDPLLLNQIFPAGSGLVVGRTPEQWLWTAQDPLLQLIGQDPHVGAIYDETQLTSRDDALAAEPQREEIWKGGNKEEYAKFLTVKSFDGNDTVYGYREPFPVSGYDGEYWIPGSIKEDSVLTVWFDEMARPTQWHKVGEFDLKGIHLWQFSPVDAFWQNETTNTNNSLYYQQVEGLINITGISPFSSFLSRGMWDGVEPQFRAQVDGLVNDDYYKTWMFGVEPESGITMAKFATKQVSFGYQRLSRFNPNFQAGSIPLFYIDDWEEISDEDADTFKSSIAMVKAAQIAFFVVGIALGLILGGFGVAILVRYHHRKGDNKSDNPLELRDIS